MVNNETSVKKVSGILNSKVRRRLEHPESTDSEKLTKSAERSSGAALGKD